VSLHGRCYEITIAEEAWTTRSFCAELQVKNDSKFLMDSGFRFSKFPTPDAMQGHDKMYSLCYDSFFCIDPTLEQTSLLSNTKAV